MGVFKSLGVKEDEQIEHKYSAVQSKKPDEDREQ